MPDQHQITILHVDDNETNRYVVSRTLQKAGFDVEEAATGETALQIIAQQQPDLVILDVRLPDIDGFEVCRRIKTNPATSFIPVLHLSASFVKSEDKAQGLDGGADGYLAQPVEPIELLATVKALLRIREAEESALTLAKEWQTTFDAMSDSVCLLDRQGKVMRCNKAMTQLLLKSETEISDRFHQELMQPILGSIEVTPFDRIQETLCRESIEIQSVDRWFSVTADPIFDEGQVFTGAVYIVADITNRVRAEEALKSSEERFRMLLENVEDYAIFFLDTDGRITRWSIGAERILGYREAEILGQPISIIFTPEDVDGGTDKQELSKAVKEGRAEDERWHLRKGGSRFWASGIVTPLRDATGQLRGFAKIMRDFTERKRSEDERAQLLAREQEARAEAEAANRMKDEFLATLSHELRSPLNAMLGWAQLLNSRKFDDATTAKAMDIIERTARTQAQLVDDLLDVSRIIQGKLRLKIRPVELSTVIGAVLDTLGPAAEAKEIQLENICDPKVGLVAGDSDRLQQIMWNLLSNAIKFTPNRGRVEIRLEQVNSDVEIKVTDTGKGISPDFVPYVFDRFRQADSSMTRRYNGLGIGLAIVRHLVDLHGGTVHAHSEGEDLGATFIVRLPIIPVLFEASESVTISTVEAGTPLDNPTDLNGLQVLVVDDDADTRLFLCTVLEQCGANVTLASSASSAFEVIQNLKPDILVSDIGMPEEDGYSLIRKVRSLSPEQGGMIPAVALTAYARSEDRTRSLLEGFQIHIPKPVEPAELAAAVANLAGRL
ncbi:response regulator [Argonema antarcticum]|uniref:hybrid sensor histidine kinase/response regulator n=1 Tax=Argonema antarcticum TaxID=2942763 RepID=UPI002013A4BE|nr:response regulator [Argonema antarcticum]MCL1474229.1 response regulator [Argonema antarcticum A004/B2]